MPRTKLIPATQQPNQPRNRAGHDIRADRRNNSYIGPMRRSTLLCQGRGRAVSQPPPPAYDLTSGEWTLAVPDTFGCGPRDLALFAALHWYGQIVRGDRHRWQTHAVAPTVGRHVGLVFLALPMPEHHEPIEVIAGETWDILCTLLDANDSPIDLTGATVEWALIDSGGNPVAIAAQVTMTDAASGAICISIPGNETAGLDPGYYNDGLRVTLRGGGRSTWLGHIQVDANRFAA
jgi:hypothetical protein